MAIFHKLLLAFALIAAVFSALGAYGYWNIESTGRLAIEIYDKPLMAINFARAAQNGFADARRLADSGRAGIRDDLQEKIDTTLEDLQVAGERAVTDDAREIVTTLSELLTAWRDAINNRAPIDERKALSSDIAEEFDALIEISTFEGFEFRSSAEESIAHSRITFVYALAAAFTLALILGLSVARHLGRPIARITEQLQRLAEGDLEIDIAGVGRKDEIGAMAKVVDVFRGNAIEMKRLSAEKDENEARIAQENAALTNKLADDFRDMVGTVVSSFAAASSEIKSSTEEMNEKAGEAGQQAVDVEEAAEQARGNVQHVAVAAEQLSKSIREITEQVARSSEISSNAVLEAERVSKDVLGLQEAATRIGAVVDLINKIAEETNLLALNATIEAARAGESGKGFAVVATEVKNLAGQTAKATLEIGEHVNDIQTAAHETVDEIQKISDTIRRIDDVAGNVAAAVEQQDTATRDIARNAEQAAQGTGIVVANIHGVGRTVNETGEVSGIILTAVDELRSQSVALDEEVSEFLGQIRNTG
jgi:methyl-accepting chemotaxis protein